MKSNGSGVLLTAELLNCLKWCPHLRHLLIQAPSVVSTSCIPNLRGRGHFIGFSNLTSLEVYNLRGKFEDLADEFSAVLFDCPHLKTLGLGMACESHPLKRYVVLESYWNSKTTFLELLCERYALGKKQQLQLKVLRLGYCTALIVEVPGADNYTGDVAKSMQSARLLEKMINTSCLERLHLFNGGQAAKGFRPLFQPFILSASFTWPVLRHISTTALRQIVICNLRPILPWLNSTGSHVTELIVSPLYGDSNGSSEAALNSLRLRMDFGSLSGPKLSFLYLQDSPLCAGVPSSRWRGLVKPVTMYLKDKGQYLTDLGISMPFNLAQWVIFLC